MEVYCGGDLLKGMRLYLAWDSGLKEGATERENESVNRLTTRDQYLVMSYRVGRMSRFQLEWRH